MNRDIEFSAESITATFSADELPKMAIGLDWYEYAERFGDVTEWIDENVPRSAMIEALASTGGWGRYDLHAEWDRAEDTMILSRNITALLLASAYDMSLEYTEHGHEAAAFDGIVECY